MAPHTSLRLSLATTCTILIMLVTVASGRTDPAKAGKPNPDEKQEERPSPQRVPSTVYENLRNTVSNIDYFTSNYGILGLNVQQSTAGGYWPRGSTTPYIFGGGIWFGARKPARDENGTVIKLLDGTDSLNKLSVISYNPNSGASWMGPGRVGPDPANSPVDKSPDAINKYRVYRSTEYDTRTGQPFDPEDLKQGGPNWPVWDTHFADTLKYFGYNGEYVDDISHRNTTYFPKGPAIISEEDIFTTFKDTDLDRYEIARLVSAQRGYPIGLQVEQTHYTWGFGDYANFIFVKYAITNRSTDTLRDCWMAPALDMDLGLAGNDRTKIVIPDKFNDSLNLAVQWTEPEASRFGYIGIDFLESPAVDTRGFLRRDRKVYSSNEQLGLKTFRNWTLQNDPKTDEERYDFMADFSRDGDTGPGDKRFLMATGPFNLLPGDTVRIVIGIMLAYGTKGGVVDGTWQDMSDLIQLDRFAQQVYDNLYSIVQPSSAPTVDVDRTVGLRLGRSYPLPAGPAVGNTMATVEYSLSTGDDVTLSVFNDIGQEVVHQHPGFLPAGDHITRIDVATLPAGVYHYELRTASGEAVRGELVVLR